MPFARTSLDPGFVMSFLPPVGFSRNATINFRSALPASGKAYADTQVALQKKPSSLTLLHVHQ